VSAAGLVHGERAEVGRVWWAKQRVAVRTVGSVPAVTDGAVPRDMVNVAQADIHFFFGAAFGAVAGAGGFVDEAAGADFGFPFVEGLGFGPGVRKEQVEADGHGGDD